MFKELETVIHCDESEQTPEPVDQPIRTSHRMRPTTVSKHEQRSRQRSYRSSQSQNHSKSPYSHSSRPVSPYNCYNGNTSAKRFQNTKQNNDLSCRSYSISDKNSKWQTQLSPENYTKEVQSPQLNIEQEMDQNVIYEQTMEYKVQPNLLVHTAILSSQKSTNSFRNNSGMKIHKLLERSMQNNYMYTENHSTDQKMVNSSSKKDNWLENQRHFQNRNMVNQTENLDHQLHMSMLLNSSSYPSQLSHLSFNDPKKQNQLNSKMIQQNNMNIIQNYQNNSNQSFNNQDCINDQQNIQNQQIQQQQTFQNKLQNHNVQSNNSIENSQRKDQFNKLNNNKKLKSSRQNVIQIQQQLHLKQPEKYTNLKPVLNLERNKISQINLSKVSLNQKKMQIQNSQIYNKENQSNQICENQYSKDNLGMLYKMGKRNEKNTTSSGQSLKSNISIQVSGKYKEKSLRNKKVMSYGGNIKQDGALERKHKNLMDTIEQAESQQQQQLSAIQRGNQANLVFDQTFENKNEVFQSPIISGVETPNPQQLYYQQEVRNNPTPIYQSNDVTKSPSLATGNLNSQYKDSQFRHNPSGGQLISERTQPNSYQMPSPHFPSHNYYLQQSSKSLLNQQSSQKEYLLDRKFQNVYQDNQYPNQNDFQEYNNNNMEQMNNNQKKLNMNNDLNSLMQSSQREIRMLGEQKQQNINSDFTQNYNDQRNFQQNCQHTHRQNQHQQILFHNRNIQANNPQIRRTPFEQTRNAVFNDQNYQDALLNGMQHSRIHDVQFFNMNETFSTGQDKQQFSSDKDNFTHYEQVSLPLINQTGCNHVNQTQQDNSMYNQNLSFSPDQKFQSEMNHNYHNEKQNYNNQNYYEMNQNGMQNYQYRQNETIEQSDSQINEPSHRSDLNMNRDRQNNMLINTYQSFSPQSYQYPQSLNQRDHPHYFHDVKNNHKTMDERNNPDHTFDNILSNGLMSQHESMNHTFSQRNSCLQCQKLSQQIPSTLQPSINQAQSSKEVTQLITYHPSQLLSPENQNTHFFEGCPCCNARKDFQAHQLMNANNHTIQGFQNFSGYFNNNQNLSNSVSTLQGGCFSSNQLLPLADLHQDFRYPYKKCDVGIQANSQNDIYFSKRAVKMIESDQEKKALKRRLGKLSSAKSKSQKKQKKSRTCSNKKQGFKYINSNSLVTIRQGKIVQNNRKSLLNNFQNQLTNPSIFRSVRSLSQKRKQSQHSNKAPQFKICQTLKEVFQHLGIQTYLHLLQDREINQVSQILLLDSDKLKQMLMPANARKLLLSYQKQLIKHLNIQIKLRKQQAKDALRKYNRKKRSNTVQSRKGQELNFQNHAQSTLQFINPPMKFHVDKNYRSKSQMLIKHLSKRKLFEDDIKVYSRNQDQLKLARQKINQKNQQQFQIMSNSQSQSSLPLVNVGYKGVSIFKGAMNKKWMGTWGDQTLKSKDTKTMNNSLKNLQQTKSPNSMSQKSILKSKSTNKFGISRNSQTSIYSKKKKNIIDEKSREQSPLTSIKSSKNNSKSRKKNKNAAQNSISGQNSIQSSQSKQISINISKNKKSEYNEKKQQQKKQKKKKKSEEKENNDNIFNLNKSSKHQKIQALLNELSNLLKEEKRTPMFTPGESKSNNQLLEEKLRKIRNTSSPSKQALSPSQYVLSSFKKQTQNKSEIVSNQNYNQDIENVILNSTENEKNLMKSRKFNQTAHIVEQLRRQIEALSSQKNTITEQSETLSKNMIDHNIKQESDYDNIFQKLTLNGSQESKNSKHYLNKLRKLSQQNSKKANLKTSETQTQIQSPQLNDEVKNESNEINMADYEQTKNLFNLDANALSFNLLQDASEYDQNQQNNQFIQNNQETNEVSQSYSGFQKQQNRKKQRLMNNLPSTQINSIDMEKNFREQENELNNIFDYKFIQQKVQRKSMQNVEHEDSSLGSSSACNQPATRRTNPCQNNQFLNYNSNQFVNNFQENDGSSAQNKFGIGNIQSQNSHITSPSYQSVNYFNDLNSNMLSNRIKESLKTKISSPKQFYQNNRNIQNQSLAVNDMTLGAQQRGANDYHQHEDHEEQEDQNEMEQEYFTQCIVGGEVVFKDTQFNMKTSPDFKDIVLNTGSSQDNFNANQYYLNQQAGAGYQDHEDFMCKSMNTQLNQIYQPKTPFTITYNTRGLPIPVPKQQNKGQDMILPYATLNSQPEFHGKQIISQFERNKYLFEKAQLDIKQFHQKIESVQNRLQKINFRVK